MSRASEETALLIIDMQVGEFEKTPPERLSGVVERINAVAGAVRAAGGLVVVIQHDAPPGEPFSPGAPGWQLVPGLAFESGDPVVHKTACDAFYETGLQERLDREGVTRLLVSGSATDFCVDTTVRAAASLDYEVTVVRDAHLTKDRDHLSEQAIIEHHEYVWENLILPRTRVTLADADQLIRSLEAAGAS
jgi:nicotinamidase-related amidase